MALEYVKFDTKALNGTHYIRLNTETGEFVHVMVNDETGDFKTMYGEYIRYHELLQDPPSDESEKIRLMPEATNDVSRWFTTDWSRLQSSTEKEFLTVIGVL